jgi:hypothetical protein
VTLIAGANIPIEGLQVQVTVRAPDLGGVLVIVEEHGAVRPLTAEDPLAPVSGERVTIPLAGVPDAVERLRVLAWSSIQTRVLEPAEIEVALDGAVVATVELKTGQPLRAAELVEVYRRHGNWKVRAVASGWIGGVEAAGAAIGIDASAFRAPSAAPPPKPRPTASPDAGPAELRPLIDEIVGPGERVGGADYIEFKLAGTYDASVVVDGIDAELTSVTAILPLGAGAAADARIAEAAARTSGEAPMGRIAFDDGHAYASVSTVVDRHALDTAVLKALLAEAWTTARDFARRLGSAWSGVQLPDDPPRELRLGVFEELGEPGSWTEIREMLLSNHFMPLVDAPQTCLAPADGTLWLGPVRLAGAARAWSVLCERVVRADVELDAAAWREIADWNTVSGPMRLGVAQEVGADAKSVLVLNFNALQVQRGQPRRDLEVGLGMVDERAGEMEPGIRQLIAGTNHRNNLPWFPTRGWAGPPRELVDDILARELVGLPEGAPPPPDFADRVRARHAALGRPGAGYVAHLALLRAERRDDQLLPWLNLATELVDLAPVAMGADGTATASIHVRRGRLQQLLAPRPRETPVPSAPPGPPPERRKRRWFGG